MGEPVLIVGAGPAGSAAAVVLAQAGRAPLLIERERQAAEKVCGCFLSIEAVAMLQSLGVSLDRLGASQIDRVRLVHHSRTVEAKLPFRARGLSRRLLDTALLEQAAQAGARIRYGTQATSIVAAPGGGIAAGLRGDADIRAATVFLATGKHEVRGVGRAMDRPPGNIAMKQMFRLMHTQTEALRGAVELYLFDGGYAGLQLVEDDIANLCLVIEQKAFQSLGGGWDALLDALRNDMPLLAERLAEAEPLIDRPLAVSNIPYGFVHRPDPGRISFHRLGDQAAVIPSFSGDGMAIALHSGIAAARCHLAGGSAGDFHRALQRALGSQFRLAGGLHRLAANGFGRNAMMIAGGISPALMRWTVNATRLRPVS